MSDRKAMPDLPPPPEPQGAYLPAVAHNGLVYTAGMTPREGGVLIAVGRVGAEVDLETARQAAGLSALRALSAAAATVGLQRIDRLLRVGVFVACTDEFTQHSVVADGASEALEHVLGDSGRAVRTALGVRALPGGACVEVELIATYTSS